MLQDYLLPIKSIECRAPYALGNSIQCFTSDGGFPTLTEGALALVGVDSNADVVRSWLYPLALPCEDITIVDLGNLHEGLSEVDRGAALQAVAEEVLTAEGSLMVLGGDASLNFYLYRAYANLNRVINLAEIAPRFALDEDEQITASSYLRHIVMQQPNYLFQMSTIGYQTYFVGQPYVKLVDDLHFDARRLGEVREHLEQAEPLLRNADLLSVDLAAVRQSDAPGVSRPSAHGFYGEELCLLAHYAGMSDKMSCVGWYGLNADVDISGQTAQMLSQVIWHFIDGFGHRLNDLPYKDPTSYKRFAVQLQEENIELVFLKSKKSDRWWMEVPCRDADRRLRYGHHLLVPCNYSDYQEAMGNELPHLWWKHYRWLQE